ncbi:NUDIX hydrolase [Histidinibacterium lentulum]|uniref:NUDIX domain-containing protein n=1 Tax=Histidinibacterium lentulum TaxID=2480588 RepID=A0A3N2QV12_9RHOB|nr:NUDIX hydrolase [Histidinibacterium lentulum]ROT99064.1 NUDIX domain-containing protein [Histidinibacterium lentulum]
MSLHSSLSRPLRLRADKTEARTQFAVLPWRVDKGKLRVCLVTSRGTGRWIIPKGWPMDDMSPAEAAAVEAWEEAGLKGRVSPRPIGIYATRKRFEETEFPVIAILYGMQVAASASSFPERAERKRKWLSPKKAAARLDEPELAHIVRRFDPRSLPR